MRYKKQNGTTNLLRHLRIIHPEVIKDNESSLMQRTIFNSSNISKSNKKMTKKENDSITKKILSFVIDYFLP